MGKKRYAGNRPHRLSDMEIRQRIQRNGITEADLRAMYQRGFEEGQKNGLAWGYDSSIGAMMLALHEEFGFGHDRLARLANKTIEMQVKYCTTQETFEELLANTGIEYPRLKNIIIGGTKKMNIRNIAKEIHENAVKHGFWEEKDIEQKFALIHDEWSEALEADRNGEPLAEIDEHGKPRGVLVELIDGVIRMIDLCEAVGLNIEEIKPMDISLGFYETVNDVHYHTAHLCGMLRLNKINPRCYERVGICCGLIFRYIIEQGYNPETILEWKHRYNISRPYKHGKKY